MNACYYVDRICLGFTLPYEDALDRTVAQKPGPGVLDVLYMRNPAGSPVIFTQPECKMQVS